MMSRQWIRPLTAAVVMVGSVTAISVGTHWYWVKSRTSYLAKACPAAAKLRDWQGLEELARQWLAIDPRNGYAWLYLGEASQRQGDFQTTAKCLASLADDDPKCVPALVELVELQLAHLNQPFAAVETCQRILRIDQQNAVAHQRLIFFYAMTLQHELMERQIQQSLAAGCYFSESIVYHVGSAELRFSNGAEVNDRWLSAGPNSELFEVARAIHSARRASAGAKSAPLIAECRRKYPHNREVQADTLAAAVADGELEKVAEVLSAASAGSEQDYRFWRAKGWLHLAQGELLLAKEAYETALRLNPYDWQSRHQFASVLRRLEETAETIQQMTTIALEGKLLERQLFELPSAAELPVVYLSQIAAYARKVGDDGFANRIELHLKSNPR